MKDRQLYLYWLYLFIVCAALGFIRERNPLVTALLFLACLAFYVPAAVLLCRDIRSGKRKNMRCILIISICSLVVTAGLFVAYWATVATTQTELAAEIVYAILSIFSTPMMCTEFPILSMFLWACLLFTVISFWKKPGTDKETKAEKVPKTEKTAKET